MLQLDLFTPAAPVKAPRIARPINNYRPDDPTDERHWVECRAWSGAIMKMRHGDRDPIEVTVRGIPTVVSFGFGFGTHAIEPPGSAYWSETGFRSFTRLAGIEGELTPARIVRIIEHFIDAPRKDGNGCGGKLVEWWPSVVTELRHLRSDYYVGYGEGWWREHGAKIAARQIEAEAKVRELGLDPDALACWGRNVLRDHRAALR